MFCVIYREKISIIVLTVNECRSNMKVTNEVKEMAIRYHLKAMLADKGMTQKELAEVTKIRAPTISAICVGSVKQLPIGVLDKICTVLDCQPGDLLEYVPTEVTAGEE